MKLQNLKINNLYHQYNYDVYFNNDITFLYGLNGCGKTTVLNITEAIITARIFDLFEYEFDSISLEYVDDDEIVNTIKVSFNVDNDNLNVFFDGSEFEIERIPDDYREDSIRTNKTKYYFKKYNELIKIYNTFNYIYLPLNRTVNTSNYMYADMEREYSYSFNAYHRIFSKKNLKMPSKLKDRALVDIEMLIYNKIAEMNSHLSQINNEFRNDILKTSLNIDKDFSIEKLLESIRKSSVSSIEQLSKEYINMLKDLNIGNDEINGYVEFFNDYIKLLKSSAEDTMDANFVNLILKYSEFIRISRLVKIAKETEAKKSEITERVQVFETLINEFFANGNADKQIKIDSLGRVGFITNGREDLISVQLLSSGERQLLIFFANLIFNVNKNEKCIFVVDEPELSLHLSWQKTFVDSAIKINPNIQMIFATHSPEFIGKHRNKMVRLIRSNCTEEM